MITGTHKGTAYQLDKIDDQNTTVTRNSPFGSGAHAKDFNIPIERFVQYYSGEGLIQQVFPELDPDDREFIMTGITPDEWPAES